MAQHGLEAIDHTVQLTFTWLKELTSAMGWEDRHRSYRLLRATLQALRDWLSVDEAAHLSAQLPMLIRGIYFEGWRPAATPVKPRNVDAFLARIDEDFVTDPLDDTAYAVSQVFALLSRHVSEGEISDVRQALSADLRALWP